MTEVAQKYLGNIKENCDLEQQVKIARDTNCFLEVYLQQNQLAKGRILSKADSGAEIGIIKSRDFVLRPGDVFETTKDNLLLIQLESEKLMVLSFEQSLKENHLTHLVSLGHILGNHHYPIKIDKNKIYVRLITDARVIVKMITELHIPGLEISFEAHNNQEISHLKHTHLKG